jgi:hypothetical protein
MAGVSMAQNNVALFRDCNYGGKRVYLAAGSYKLYQMQMDNDALSSMQIPRGFRVTIYEHDDFQGQSSTYTGNVSCLPQGWDNNTSSLVVENLNSGNPYNQNEYVTFYNDCYNRGYSQSLRPGTYYGSQLGSLKYNLSSFTITGNLQVKLYVNNENAAGYSQTFLNSETCLPDNFNDKVGSLIIEAKSYDPYNNNNNNNNQYGNSYATVYTDCNYRGSSLRLAPGRYEGDKLGLLKYDISSIEIPSNLTAKVYVNNEYLRGNYYTISQNSTCLGYATNNKIGSLVIEAKSGYNNNNYPNNNYPNNTNEPVVTIYSDEDYKGLSASLLPGTYATMEQAGFPNDALSSLTLPEGYRVVIWEFENFKGKSYTITRSKPGFLLSNWNDKTSSIAVYRQ